MKSIHTTTDPKQVSLLEMALRGAGIEYRLDNFNSAFASEVGPNPAVPVGFLVRDEDVDAATRIIDDALRRMGEWPKRLKAE